MAEMERAGATGEGSIKGVPKASTDSRKKGLELHLINYIGLINFFIWV